MTRKIIVAAIAAAVTTLVMVGTTTAQTQHRDRAKPTIVLVHGAFADSSSWQEVSRRLHKSKFHVVAAANPLRGLASDSDYVTSTIEAIDGPIILVGHSYGGAVITNAARGNSNVKALVYIAGFAPETGESAAFLSGKFPGSTLSQTLEEIPLSDGQVHLRIRQDLFPQQFAADVPRRDAALMAVAQRPITVAALNEASGEPAWRSVRSYFLIPTADKNIPPASQRFMANRAGGTTVTADGASHAVLVSKPTITTRLIERAARETA